MSVKKLNLVKYAGDFWVTLADFTQTRSVEGYSDHASVKAAVRTFVVRQSPEKYLAFRGEKQLKNIIQENNNNPFFYPEDFQGHTRTALIHWDMVEGLHERFKVSKEYKKDFSNFITDAKAYIENNANSVSSLGTNPEDDLVQERSTMIRYLRSEVQKLDKEIEAKQNNREKLLQALNALESLELDVL